MEKVALMGLPWDAHSSHLRGTAAAPALIRQALHSGASNLSNETGVDLGVAGAEGRFVDIGDVGLRNEPGEHGVEAIQSAVAGLLDSGYGALCLGGDHTVTYPVLRAYGEAFNDLTLVHFDAHSDLYPEYEGDRLSHACPFARIMEEGAAKRLIQLGIRTLNPIQRQQAERFGVEIHEMRHMAALKPEDLKLQGNVYISLDLDALDPAYAPGISHREPGGFSSRQVIDWLHGLGELQQARWVGADIVEYNPTQDLQGVTAVLAAKLLKELAALLLD